MGVRGTGVDLQFPGHLATEAIVRQHPLDSMFQHDFWLHFQNVFERLKASTPRIQSIVIVFLQLLALPCHNDLFRVDNHYEITEVSVRRERRFVFPTNDVSYLRGHSTQRFAARIDEKPLLDSLFIFEESCVR